MTTSEAQEAQTEYDESPELRDLLARAAKSPTIHKARERRQGS